MADRGRPRFAAFLDWLTGQGTNVGDAANSAVRVNVVADSSGSGPLPTNAAQETGGHLQNIDQDIGAKTDAAATDSTSAWSVISILKGLWAKLAGVLSTNLFVGGLVVSNTNPVPITGSITSTGATLNILSALSAVAWDLNSSASGAYNQTTAISGPYAMTQLNLNFSSNLPKTIELIDVTTGVHEVNLVNDTRTDVPLNFYAKGKAGGQQLQLKVSSTGGACAMTFQLLVQNGQLPMSGGGGSVANPIFVAGGFLKDTNNSWASPTTLPTAGTVTTGTATDVSGYSAITYDLNELPDQMTTPSTLAFQFSVDNVNWDTAVTSTINDGNIVIPVPLRPVAQYFRLQHTQGSSNATSFRLTTYLHRTAPDQLVRTLGQIPQINDPSSFVRAFIEPSFQGQENLIAADRAMDGSANVLPFIAQDKWQFDAPFANNNIVVVQAGGATATQSPSTGAKLQSANAGGASSAQILGQKKVRYSPTYEVREIGSAVFPLTPIANSRALIGLTDQITPGSTTQIDPTVGNTIAVGSIGTTFGFHLISGGSATTIPRSQWNGDPSLSGAATAANGLLGLSAFRSGNKPFEWNPAISSNPQGWAYRIRYKYFGVAFVRLEVESPDGVWIVAHTIRGPYGNVPNIQSPNLFMFEEVTKLAGSAAGTLISQSFSVSAGCVAPEIFYEAHEVNGHKQVTAPFSGLSIASGANSTQYTVSAGRQLLVNSISLSADYTSANGRIELRDGGAGGALKWAMQGGQANSIQAMNPSFPTPLIFLTDVTLVSVGSNTLSSGCVSGYEKEA